MSKPKYETNVSSELELKSDLLNLQRELNEKNDELLREMQQRTYEIKFEKPKIFNKLVKFLEKDAPWGHTTAAGLVMLYHNLREQRSIVKSDDWNGLIELRSANVSVLWQMLSRMTGTGFFQARDFIELMATIGEPISEAYNKVVDDNAELRENHHKLALVDQRLDEGNFIDDEPKGDDIDEAK